MYNWLANLVGFNVANFILLVVGLLCVIIAVFVVVKLIRRLTSGTYIAGGKDRQPRLSVKDALPIDKMRQIVLISRDNVEHLIMIGGPNDLLIESNIKKQILSDEIQRIEPQIKIDDVPSNKNYQTQNTQSAHSAQSEPDFVSQTQVGSKSDPQIQKSNMPTDLNADPFQEFNEKTSANTQTAPTRLHPTYPLKQVSAGIYSGRTTRPLEENDITNEKPSTMRVENPYRKEPQSQSNFNNQESDKKVEPEFSSSSEKQTMSFPTNILKDTDSK